MGNKVINESDMNLNTMSLNTNEQMIYIMKIIWSSRSQQQLEGCQNMINTFEQKHGEDNIGLTLLEIEMARQQRLNGLFAKMGNVANTLKETQGKQKEYKDGKIKS